MSNKQIIEDVYTFMSYLIRLWIALEHELHRTHCRS